MEAIGQQVAVCVVSWRESRQREVLVRVRRAVSIGRQKRDTRAGCPTHSRFLRMSGIRRNRHSNS